MRNLRKQVDLSVYRKLAPFITEKDMYTLAQHWLLADSVFLERLDHKTLSNFLGRLGLSKELAQIIKNQFPVPAIYSRDLYAKLVSMVPMAYVNLLRDHHYLMSKESLKKASVAELIEIGLPVGVINLVKLHFDSLIDPDATFTIENPKEYLAQVSNRLKARLSLKVLRPSDLEAVVKGSNLHFLDFQRLPLVNPNLFRGKSLMGSSFYEMSLPFFDFSECDLRWTLFRRAGLRHSLFKESMLSRADFAEIDGFGLDLRCIQSVQTNAKYSNFEEAVFNGARFVKTWFNLSNFRKVNFSGSYFRQVNFAHAVFDHKNVWNGASLIEVNFSGAIGLNVAHLKKYAFALIDVRLPDNTVLHPQNPHRIPETPPFDETRITTYQR